MGLNILRVGTRPSLIARALHAPDRSLPLLCDLCLCVLCVKFRFPMASVVKSPPARQAQHRRTAFVRAAAPLAVGIAIALAPAPHGLAPNARRDFALFAAVMVATVPAPTPAAALRLTGVLLAA